MSGLGEHRSCSQYCHMALVCVVASLHPYVRSSQGKCLFGFQCEPALMFSLSNSTRWNAVPSGRILQHGYERFCEVVFARSSGFALRYRKIAAEDADMVRPRPHCTCRRYCVRPSGCVSAKISSGARITLLAGKRVRSSQYEMKMNDAKINARGGRGSKPSHNVDGAAKLLSATESPPKWIWCWTFWSLKN